MPKCSKERIFFDFLCAIYNGIEKIIQARPTVFISLKMLSRSNAIMKIVAKSIGIVAISERTKKLDLAVLYFPSIISKKPRSNLTKSWRKIWHTAIREPKWTAISICILCRVMSKKKGKAARWADEDTGINSVKP